jgi:hypothetical protein
LIPYSPAPSVTSFDDSTILNSTPISKNPSEPTSPLQTFHTPAPVLAPVNSNLDTSEALSSNEESNVPEKNDSDGAINSSKEHKDKDEHKEKVKAEKKAAKKLLKELTICKIILEEMEVITNEIFKKFQISNLIFFRFMKIPGHFCYP